MLANTHTHIEISMQHTTLPSMCGCGMNDMKYIRRGIGLDFFFGATLYQIVRWSMVWPFRFGSHKCHSHRVASFNAACVRVSVHNGREFGNLVTAYYTGSKKMLRRTIFRCSKFSLKTKCGFFWWSMFRFRSLADLTC